MGKFSYTYSFLDIQAAIDGPGGNFPLAGDEAGVAEEGITIEPRGDKNEMTVGADSAVMHSLYGDKSGTLTVRLLRTSTVNQQLMNMYNAQTASSRDHGQNTVTVRDVVRGDTITCTQVAFGKAPATPYAKAGGLLEWVFHVGVIDRQIGSGAPEID